MRSFAAISTFAVLAFSAFSSAAPLAPRTDLQSVPVIFTNLKSELTPLVAQLSTIQKSNATAAVVGPIASQIKDSISKAATSVTALKGQSQATVLESAPLANVAQLVTDVLVLLLPTLGKVQTIVGPGGDLDGVLPPIGAGLATLLGALVPQVAGLVAALIPQLNGLLAGLSGLITSLGLGGLIVLLGL